MDPDLLGGKDHPTITFKSARVEAIDLAHWKVTGDLTIHGVARPVVLDTRYLGQAKHPFTGKIAAAFRAETAIDRRDFGVTWNAAMPTGHGGPVKKKMPPQSTLTSFCRLRSPAGGGWPL